MNCLTERTDGVEIRVKVVPGASRERIIGPLGDSLKVQVSAAPEKGKANASVAALLAARLGLSAKYLSLVSGASGPRKVFRIRGLTVERVAALLGLA